MGRKSGVGWLGLLDVADRPGRLGRRARWLAAASVAYTGAEAVLAIAAGAVAGSIALVGFGLDSAVEVSSAVMWNPSCPS